MKLIEHNKNIDVLYGEKNTCFVQTSLMSLVGTRPIISSCHRGNGSSVNTLNKRFRAALTLPQPPQRQLV